jgi:energy-coupling factor transporter transmembrane protein EcfT
MQFGGLDPKNTEILDRCFCVVCLYQQNTKRCLIYFIEATALNFVAKCWNSLISHFFSIIIALPIIMVFKLEFANNASISVNGVKYYKVSKGDFG